MGISFHRMCVCWSQYNTTVYFQEAKEELKNALCQLEEAHEAATLAAEEASHAESVGKALEKARDVCLAHAESLKTACAELQAQEFLLKGVKVHSELLS
jgi:hypothetical protein